MTATDYEFRSDELLDDAKRSHAGAARADRQPHSGRQGGDKGRDSRGSYSYGRSGKPRFRLGILAAVAWPFATQNAVFNRSDPDRPSKPGTSRHTQNYSGDNKSGGAMKYWRDLFWLAVWLAVLATAARYGAAGMMLIIGGEI